MDVRTLWLAALLVATPWSSGSALAVDEPDELMPGAAVVVDAGRRTLRFRARPATGSFDLPDLPDHDPSIEGATLAIYDTVAPGAGANVFALAPGPGWQSLASGGWRYRQPGFPVLQFSDAACQILIRPTIVKGFCQLPVTLTPPLGGDLQVVLSVGTASHKRYCATFGGTTRRNAAGVLRRRQAPSAACAPMPCGGSLATWGTSGTGNGEFDGPDGVAVDGGGNVFVVDIGNHRIQKFDANGTFLTTWGSFGTGQGQFNTPDGVALDGSGNVHVTDLLNHRVQKFDGNGTFLAAWGSFGTGDGQFNGPAAAAVDGAGNVYVADFFNQRIQKFDAGGAFLTKWGSFGSGDGQLFGPESIAVDGSGNVYVADIGNDRIQKFDAGGTFLAKWGQAGNGPGEFDQVIDVAVDAAGDVYVVDLAGTDVRANRVQKFDANGGFLTMWGGPGTGEGQLHRATGVAADPSGNVYVTEASNDRVQKFACP